MLYYNNWLSFYEHYIEITLVYHVVHNVYDFCTIFVWQYHSVLLIFHVIVNHFNGIYCYHLLLTLKGCNVIRISKILRKKIWISKMGLSQVSEIGALSRFGFCMDFSQIRVIFTKVLVLQNCSWSFPRGTTLSKSDQKFFKKTEDIH